VNAAFLLVSASLMTANPPASTDACGPRCGPSCSSGCVDPCGCEGFGHRLRDRLKDLFHRDCCGADACASTTCHTPACKPSCETRSCRTWHWDRSCCNTGCASSCDPCNQGGCNLLSKLHGLFHRDSCCGGFGCHGDACAPATTTTPPATDPGKKMPKSDSKAKQEVRIITPPAEIAPAVANPIPVNAPAIVPPPPVIDDVRSPF